VYKRRGKKIAIAMSGGVDSSVSSYLLKKEGYDLSGFYMNLGCGSGIKAKKVAKELKIPFFEINGKNIFRRSVIKYFIEEYKNLRTPNPCVVCNKNIKFGWLLDTIKKNKFNMLATGHYVRVKKDKNGIFHLLTGKDETKDQSYFLYRLDQAQLSHVIFPLGEMTKVEARKIARKNKLPIDADSESQEVCFLGDTDYRDFLQKNIPKNYFKPGKIVDAKGNVIGRHEGLINYTIGQRKGINQIGVKDENKKRLYVVGFNQKKNELFIGTDRDLLKKEIIASDLTWVSSWAKEKALFNKNLKAKIRYRHIPSPCSIKLSGKKLQATFKTPQRAIVPGQSLVIYSGEEVLGGGVIE
jgi:tRNA-specific 2-thiouridylase